MVTIKILRTMSYDRGNEITGAQLVSEFNHVFSKNSVEQLDKEEHIKEYIYSKIRYIF